MSKTQEDVKKGKNGYLPFEKFNTYGQPIIHFCHYINPYVIRYWWSVDRQEWIVSLWADDECIPIDDTKFAMMLAYIELKEKIWWDKYGFLRKNEQESQERTE